MTSPWGPPLAITTLDDRPAEADEDPAIQLLLDVELGGASVAAYEAVAAEHPDLRPLTLALAGITGVLANDRRAVIGEHLRAAADELPHPRLLTIAQLLCPSIRSATARVALSCAADRHGAVVALTHGVDAVDDIACLVLAYRGTSLATLGLAATAAGVFDTIDARRHLHPRVRTFARDQRRAARAWPVG